MESTQSSDLSFERFSQLPPVLRTMIWDFALADTGTFKHQVIRVFLMVHFGLTEHRCVRHHQAFCRRHGYCEYANSRATWFAIICVPHGFFAAPKQIMDRYHANPLSLACQESRDRFLTRYPVLMRVYLLDIHPPLRPNLRYRMLRCNPETDLLLLLGMYSTASQCREPIPESREPLTPHPYVLSQADGGKRTLRSGMRQQQRLARYSLEVRYPRDPENFAQFRQIVSSFRNVAFNYLGDRLQSEDAVDLELITQNYSRAESVFHLLESLEHVYMWLEPDVWPEVGGNPVKIEDLQILRPNRPLNRDIEELFQATGAAKAKVAPRREIVRLINSVAEDGSGHWLPRPGFIQKLGCYAPACWFSGERMEMINSWKAS